MHNIDNSKENLSENNLVFFDLSRQASKIRNVYLVRSCIDSLSDFVKHVDAKYVGH